MSFWEGGKRTKAVESRERYHWKVGQQLVVSVRDFLDYVASADNWNDEANIKKTQEMLYALKYEIWANSQII
jgi:hypothetical protein